MTRIDLSPFRAMTVGFDSLFNDIADYRPNNYPPYNIVKFDNKTYELSFAVAGFSKKEISVTQKEGNLFIEGNNSVTDEKEYLHKGIAERDFKQSFKLSEYMIVTDAKLENGLLKVLLVQELPKEKQPKEIKIN
jgi:molecular chaperone IbpA|tara:strand:- start:2028 stop:2429 length:402 start_codon:yes stop_codon:yes gene_type:complete